LRFGGCGAVDPLERKREKVNDMGVVRAVVTWAMVGAFVIQYIQISVDRCTLL